MRLTHRRCRHEVEGLAVVALRQTVRAEGLAVKVENRDAKVEDLAARLHDLEMSEGHFMQELRFACEDPDYTSEAVIPEFLRTLLLLAHDRADLEAAE